MTDYSALLAKDLKQLLKDRGIPLTGLTKKAQFIEALEKADVETNAQKDAPDASHEDSGEAHTVEKQEKEPDLKKDDGKVVPLSQPETQANEDGLANELPTNLRDEADIDTAARDDGYHAGDGVANGVGEATVPAVGAMAATINNESQTQNESEPPAETAAKARHINIADNAPVTNDAPAPEDASAGQAIMPKEETPTLEKSQTAESIPIDASGSITHASTMDSIRTEELVEDRMKRKRRSATPSVDESEIVKKKLRQDNDDGKVHLQEDLSGEGAVAPTSGEAMNIGDDAYGTSAPREREGRYRDLIPPSKAQRTTQPALTDDDDRSVAPSIHPATSAIYISNLQRPLNPASLRAHLLALAASPDADSDPSVIQAFFVDNIKSHAFARFATLKAASRVRASLHDRAWPAERDRKLLGVDFIPELKCEEWIDLESESSRTRWEVVYDETEDGVTTRLVEFGTAGNRKPSQPIRKDSERDVERQAPERKSPLMERRTELPTKASAPPMPADEVKKVMSLDKAFHSTTAKPKLYFLPVGKALADKRLDEFDGLVSRDWAGRRATEAQEDELRRFTFEDGDVLVDAGFHPIPGRGRGGGFGGGGPPRRGGYGRGDGGFRGPR